VGRAYLYLCWMLTLRREWDLVARYLAPAIAYCREHGQELSLDQPRSFRMQADLAGGRWDEAVRAADGVLARPQPSAGPHRCYALLVRAAIRARRGQADHRPLLDEARDLAAAPGVAYLMPSVAAARAEAAWLDGRTADVAAEADLAPGPALGLDPLTALDLRCWRWRAGADPGRADDLPEPYRMLLAGDRQGASRWWREHGSPYEAGLALAGSGDVAALRAAIAGLSGLGARAAVAVLARELRSLGERHVPREPRPATSAHPAGLTAREVEVLRLLAGGMRNAEIAARLVVSPRTVDHHVSAVLRKLNARTRSEAITAALRLGLVQA
jgi:DNA-binding CsgD family transcriptional regulator